MQLGGRESSVQPHRHGVEKLTARRDGVCLPPQGSVWKALCCCCLAEGSARTPGLSRAKEMPSCWRRAGKTFGLRLSTAALGVPCIPRS